MAAVNSRCQASAQGQAAGMRRVDRRADRVTRAATLISCRRRVAVVALAWKVEAREPGGAGEVERDRGEHQPGGVRGEAARG